MRSISKFSTVSRKLAPGFKFSHNRHDVACHGPIHCDVVHHFD